VRSRRRRTHQSNRWIRANGLTPAVTLSHAQARSGGRVAIAAYLGSGNVFDRAILAFSEAYAEQNDRDHKALVEAVKTGRFPALHSYSPRGLLNTRATDRR